MKNPEQLNVSAESCQEAKSPKEGEIFTINYVLENHLGLINYWLDHFKVREAISVTGQEFEDLRQEIFVKIIKGLREAHFKDEAELKNWMIKIIENHCIDKWREAKRGRAQVIKWGIEVRDDIKQDLQDETYFQDIQEKTQGTKWRVSQDTRREHPLASLLRKEFLKSCISLMADKLSARDRELFRLALQGNSNAEIAEEMGMSAGAVRTAKKRAFDKLYYFLCGDKLPAELRDVLQAYIFQSHSGVRQLSKVLNLTVEECRKKRDLGER